MPKTHLIMIPRSLKWRAWLIITVVAAAGIVISMELVHQFNEGMETSSVESITISNLRLERSMWLSDGCPQPPQATNYIEEVPPNRNYTYTNLHVINERKYHCLFAMEDPYLPGIFVITTDNQILMIEKSGQVKPWTNQVRGM